MIYNRKLGQKKENENYDEKPSGPIGVSSSDSVRRFSLSCETVAMTFQFVGEFFGLMEVGRIEKIIEIFNDLIHRSDEAGSKYSENCTRYELQEEAVEPHVEAKEEVATAEL